MSPETRLDKVECESENKMLERKPEAVLIVLEGAMTQYFHWTCRRRLCPSNVVIFQHCIKLHCLSMHTIWTNRAWLLIRTLDSCRKLRQDQHNAHWLYTRIKSEPVLLYRVQKGGLGNACIQTLVAYRGIYTGLRRQQNSQVAGPHPPQSPPPTAASA